MPTKYSETLCPQVIYVFRILDEDHKDCLKIGMTKLSGTGFDLNNLPENCEVLNAKAKARIDSYTATAATRYELLHTECSLFWGKHGLGAFDDHTVHEILIRSGVQKKNFSYNSSAKEWFITDLSTVKKAISAAKEGRFSISPDEISNSKDSIIFRPEQEEAIQKAVNSFSTPGSRMLWNCKMRFGKTLSALEVVKRKGFHRTLIVTHRPVVDAGWYDDFDKIFYDSPNYKYGSNERGETFENLIDSENSFIYFASLQFLRQDGDTSTKQLRDSILSLRWDMLIVDEAHEGTLTIHGQNVLKRLCKKKTCILNLSGTPFNIVSEYEPEEIFNWTYVDEQRAKEQWTEKHPCDHNPYGGLPHMNMAIYDLNEAFDKYESHDGDIQFNFREFFRTWKGNISEDHRQMPEDIAIGDFVHMNDVNRFLDLLVKPDPNTNYPFSTAEYREIFRHTFWVLPGVAAAKALKSLLEIHPIFSNFEIVNVAGEGDDEESRQVALTKVMDAIGKKPEETRTITLTCANGRLTTGVTIKPWTAVFMLYGASKTKAQGYMQTIFRVQTPAIIGGKRKEECYVFDFAPDRVVTAIDETVRANRYAHSGKPGTQKDIVTDEERQDFKDFIHYFSVIAYDGSAMREYDVSHLLEHLKRVQIERVVRNGFEDDALYNNDLLMNLDNKAMDELEGIKGIIGSSSPQPKMGDFIINDQGLDGIEETRTKSKNTLSAEEKQARKEKATKRKQKKDAISILRGISIRIPMLIYGADVKDNDTDITLENFTSFIDKESWTEFMPNGISMQKFYSLRKYYDPDVFVACGKRIRAKAAAADKLPPLQRIHKIEDILSTFRNPDKETVITPWRVVNMHLSETIGGYDFYDESHQLLQDEPRFVDRGGITYSTIEKEEPNILEINSKSGRYPLYMAYSLYRQKFKQWEAAGLVANFSQASIEEHLAVWDDVVKNNIYVLCKTPMAARITKRTLVGFRDVDVNAAFYENLIQVIKEKPSLFLNKISNKKFWHKDKNGKMKFNAIIGNPPYQIMDGGAGVSARPVYNLFIDIAKQISPDYISMITPSRWFAGGKGLDDFRASMLNDRRIAAITDFVNAKDCFPTSSIGGGVNYFVWDKNYNGDCAFTGVQGVDRNTERRVLNEFPIFVRYNKAVDIIHKITNEHSISDLISSRNPYGLSSNTRGKATEYKGSYKLVSSEGISYISQDLLENNNPLIDCYKILASKVTAEHAGEPDKQGMFKVLSRTEIIDPGTICTDSYLIIGGFEKQSEAEALYSYLCTRFVRFLLLQAVTSINLSKDKFQFIPLQDFTKDSDINWEQSIFEIERQLYKKYHLTTEDVSYIESLIRPMS